MISLTNYILGMVSTVIYSCIVFKLYDIRKYKGVNSTAQLTYLLIAD